MFGVILLGVTLSIDAVFVGITYGIRGTRVPLLSCAVILFFSALYAGIAVLCGSFLKTIISPPIIRAAGALLLALLGVNMIAKAFKAESAEKKKSSGLSKIVDLGDQVFKNPNVGDLNDSGDIDVKEAFFLTLALSADALVAGIAGGMLALSVWLFPIVTGVFQTGFLCLGIFLGNSFKKKIRLHDKYISVIAGISIIAFAFLKLL